MRSFTTLFLAAAASTLATAQTTTSSPPAATCAPEATVSNNIPQPSGAPNIDACPSSIPLGGTCGADAQCMDGAQCFGSTAFTIRACGNFNAACDDDSQCAFNTCNNGLCNGFIASSSASATTSAAPTGVMPSAGYPGGYGNGTRPYGSASGSYPSSTIVPQQPVGSGAERFGVAESLFAAVAGIAALLV